MISLARGESGDPKGAIKAADRCIEIYYLNAACHTQRAEALHDLGQISESNSELDVARNVANSYKADAQQSLESAAYQIDRDLITSRMNRTDAVIERIESDRMAWSSK